jgi:hypothetical protein
MIPSSLPLTTCLLQCRYTLVRLCCIYLILIPVVHAANDAAYYRPGYSAGSESLYSPLHNFFSYTFDTLQLPDNFATADFRQHANQVLDHLRHPRRAINSEGGFNRFVNRQLFPVDSRFADESYAALPNYALHLLGGGMVYRKDLEYFRAHHADHPGAYASGLAMSAELLQEILEKATTTNDDEIADIYIFRPLGIWLFSDDAIAEFIMHTLDPAIWPYMQAFSVSTDRISNTGLNYIYRPPATEVGNARLFILTGLNNLFGLSHSMTTSDRFSWGLGLATQRIDFTLDKQAELEPSLGLFYDSDKSLLWSVVLNDTGSTDFRFNLFPATGSLWRRCGYFISRDELQAWTVGVSYQLPLGIAFGNH